MTEPSDGELLERFRGVAVDHVNKHFYRGLLARELRLHQCQDCGWWHHRPKPVCPRCWSKHVVATPVSGRGTIHLAIFLHQGPPADGVDYEAGPHPVITVELEEQEGLRFTSTVVGSPNDAMVIGAPVELHWIERDGRPFPAFALRGIVIGDANPARDRVAFASAATTGFGRDLGDVTPGSLAVDACMAAIRECGIAREEINGLVGANPQFVQSALGIPHLTYWSGPGIPFVAAVANAMNAIAAGAADVVLAYHSLYRNPMFSRAAARDPFRAASFGLGGMPAGMASDGFGPDSIAGAVGYTAWASRYLHEYGATRETFGRIAVNDRSNAGRNPAAVLRDPITMDDYFAARMIRWPLCLLDMDVPVDGADAFVITTAERARDLALPPVLIHACTQGMIAQNEEDQTPSLHDHGQHVVVQSLRAKSDLWLDDVDVYFPYDGFSFITVSWIENTGWCKPGEALSFLEQHWDPTTNRVLIDGRIPVNPHGGALSEGGTQGSGHVREAIHQIQGRAGERQVADASTALVTAGGFFFNAQGCVLRSDR